MDLCIGEKIFICKKIKTFSFLSSCLQCLLKIESCLHWLKTCLQLPQSHPDLSFAQRYIIRGERKSRSYVLLSVAKVTIFVTAWIVTALSSCSWLCDLGKNLCWLCGFYSIECSIYTTVAQNWWETDWHWKWDCCSAWQICSFRAGQL